MDRVFETREVRYSHQFLLMCSIGLNIGLILGFVVF